MLRGDMQLILLAALYVLDASGLTHSPAKVRSWDSSALRTTTSASWSLNAASCGAICQTAQKALHSVHSAHQIKWLMTEMQRQ